jgi:hypothetical protein
VHARPNHRLEDLPEDVAGAKAAVAINRERRMIRNLVIEIEATEPAIGKVEFDFFAQLPLRTNSIAVSDDEHPDHELGIDRRSTKLAIKGFQLVAKLSQYPRHARIDTTQEMTHWNAPFEVEEIEQLALIDRLPTHHDRLPVAESLKQTES